MAVVVMVMVMVVVVVVVVDNSVEVTCEAGGKLRQQSWVCDWQEKFSRSSTGTNIAKGSLPGASNKVSNEMGAQRLAGVGCEDYVSEYDVNGDQGHKRLKRFKLYFEEWGWKWFEWSGSQIRIPTNAWRDGKYSLKIWGWYGSYLQGGERLERFRIYWKMGIKMISMIWILPTSGWQRLKRFTIYFERYGSYLQGGERLKRIKNMVWKTRQLVVIQGPGKLVVIPGHGNTWSWSL